ncbi:MAG: NUDIX hydrolase [Pyrinomonadaceae bacterium]
MLKNIARASWRILPGKFRSEIVRLTQSKFTCSVAAVILNHRCEVLLLNHVLRPYSGWGLPGGFIEAGEQPEEAIRREIREETGLELDALRMFRVRVSGSHIEMLFAAESSGDAKVMSREIIGLGWFTLDNMPADFSRSQFEIVRKVLNSEI